MFQLDSVVRITECGKFLVKSVLLENSISAGSMGYVIIACIFMRFLRLEA